MSKITVTTIAGQTSGSDANKVKIESGDTLEVVSNATVGGTLGVTGDLTVDTTTLKVDATNNRVGVGTASPTSNLHVSGGAGANIGIQSSAGTHWRIGDGVGSTNGNLVIYDYTDSAKRLEIDTDGHVTMPSQPAFLVVGGSDQNNLAINTTHDITVWASGTEVFDQNADFASNQFTAPITGRYQLNLRLLLISLDASNAFVNVYIVTSNRQYGYTIHATGYDSDGYVTAVVNQLVDMDAGDTAKITLQIPNDGTAQTDVSGANSYFSGYLVA